MDKRVINAKRIVVKVGTSSLIYPNGSINLKTFDELAYTLSALNNQGKELILVSSGAIGVGLNKMHLKQRPTEIGAQQALAAIGQSELMTLFTQRFDHYLTDIAQVLLTHDIFDYPKSKQFVMNTFDCLLRDNVIPIVNENDTVATDELDHKTTFGDNDQLSAIVASHVNADLLIVLSDVDGFYDQNPNKCADANLIETVNSIDENEFGVAGGTGSRFGTGGMQTKLLAAKRMLDEDRMMVLANGADPRIIFKILAGQTVGTIFEREGVTHE
ncbi:Glutamate 5-kinase 1 [Lentilactobacillus parabuchneri]|uniref:Glutamate 5-kinase n=2 Tax=Lentilactobacillus parabuchneri TaxID=152331 RepID=A0A1X1FEE6_9LACO|nr:glutamate 5-kinase [Lentilactobacillus parabuchneri]APR07590.1 Glutamate 5-kinase 1 [Lentilactobacillus parabuchneri]KRM46000.1 glutamate 5-kinase [Lentilactobacillus parabuchneri DSM 5707 = NBRC 107865]KRN72865.1 glutamate 5-kinase [Lentilactobacillus parabuchneri]MBW0222932.1 glutamate 5-kinase [Lentilactobacillus parabuchneri]MBW0245964.1 glutamate 5-kinase [Lentilactobacillus parabuchneri]